METRDSSRRHRQTVVLDEATQTAIEAARERLSHGRIRPSVSAIVREAIVRGLPTIAPAGARPDGGR